MEMFACDVMILARTAALLRVLSFSVSSVSCDERAPPFKMPFVLFVFQLLPADDFLCKFPRAFRIRWHEDSAQIAAAMGTCGTRQAIQLPPSMFVGPPMIINHVSSYVSGKAKTWWRFFKEPVSRGAVTAPANWAAFRSHCQKADSPLVPSNTWQLHTYAQAEHIMLQAFRSSRSSRSSSSQQAHLICSHGAGRELEVDLKLAGPTTYAGPAVMEQCSEKLQKQRARMIWKACARLAPLGTIWRSSIPKVVGFVYGV